jgi:protein-S-isoprenylcysteine O-methyltransferase Ste14
MHGTQETSRFPRFILLLLILTGLAASAFLLWNPIVYGWAGIEIPVSSYIEYLTRWVLYACFVIYLLRLILGTLIFLRRHVPLEEALVVGIWIIIIFVGLSFGWLYKWWNNWVTLIIGGVLFLVGSFLNTASELQRHQWKKNPNHKGKLYTQGLFHYSMHINYFGDVVFTVGLCIIAGNPITLLIPIAMASMFYTMHIPQLDAYLAKRYGNAFGEYAKKTPSFIPGLPPSKR